MIYIARFKTGDDGTFGHWSDDEGLLTSPVYTVERPKIGDHPCIDDGVFTFRKYQSPTKGDVWLRDDCGDGRTMIEIHPANWASQLLGCIAPGKAMEKINGVFGVSSSDNTFTMLKSLYPDTIRITIRSDYD